MYGIVGGKQQQQQQQQWTEQYGSMEKPSITWKVLQNDHHAMLWIQRVLGESWWNKKCERGELSGEEWVAPTWVSKRYAGDGAQIDALSIRCPMQLVFEKSREEESLSSCREQANARVHSHTASYCSAVSTVWNVSVPIGLANPTDQQ